jgi:hypothetical protein
MAAITGTALLAGATVYGANKASKASKGATNAMRDTAAETNALSREQFDWNKWVYENDIAPANKANQELQMLLSEDYLDSSRQQKEFAQEQRDEYKNTFLPNERKVVADAAGYDSEANINRRSGRAVANVDQQFSKAIGQRSRAAGRYGLGSSAFTNGMARDSLAQAATAAGAATNEANNTEDRAIALRAGASNLGRGLPNTSAQFFAGSGNANAGASGASSESAAAAGRGTTFMNQAYNNRLGGINNSGVMLANANANEAARWGQITQGLGGLTGATFNAGGGWGGIQAGLGNLFKTPSQPHTTNTYGPGATGGW